MCVTSPPLASRRGNPITLSLAVPTAPLECTTLNEVSYGGPL